MPTPLASCAGRLTLPGRRWGHDPPVGTVTPSVTSSASRRAVSGVHASRYWPYLSVVVLPASDGATRGSEDHEDQADDDEDDADRGEDRDAGHPADHEQDDAEDDHDGSSMGVGSVGS